MALNLAPTPWHNGAKRDENQTRDLRPTISIKFGRKMRYVNYLNELEQFMHLEQLLIPKQVLE